jgi:hypothetical protein
MKKLVLTLTENFEHWNKKIILPFKDNKEMSLYLSTKLEKEVSFLTYDSLTASAYDGYIAVDGDYYDFYLDVFEEI